MNLQMLKSRPSIDGVNLYAPEQVKESIFMLQRHIAQVRGDINLHMIEIRAVEREIHDALNHYFAPLRELLEHLEGVEETGQEVAQETAPATATLAVSTKKNVKNLYTKLANLWRNGEAVLAPEEEELLQLLSAAYKQVNYHKEMELSGSLEDSNSQTSESLMGQLSRLSREYDAMLQTAAKMSMWKRELWNSPGYILHQRIQMSQAIGENLIDTFKTLLQKLVKQRGKLVAKAL